MNFLDLFLEIFSTPADRKAPTGFPKFVEGTQWTCPVCDEVLATVKRDIYPMDSMRSSDFGLPLFSCPPRHCGTPAIRYNSLGRFEIHTPTGWVG